MCRADLPWGMHGLCFTVQIRAIDANVQLKLPKAFS